MSPYWICQITGWSLMGIVTATIPTLYGGMRWTVVARALVGAILGLLLTDQLRRHMRRHDWLRLPPLRLAPRIILASLVIAATMVLAVLPFLLRIIPPDRTGPFATILIGQVTVILGWCGIYLGMHYLRGLRAAETDKWRLEVAMRETEVRALRAQLNPHFLFNSLNSLRGLVTEDSGRARDAVTGLAALLRLALLSSRTQTITLERELEATRHYLQLESLRFESRLRFRIDADPQALGHPVPPLLIQTLVENGIKHGIARLADGGSITIEARKRAHDLHIRVTNTGTLDPLRESRLLLQSRASRRWRVYSSALGDWELIDKRRSNSHADLLPRNRDPGGRRGMCRVRSSEWGAVRQARHRARQRTDGRTAGRRAGGGTGPLAGDRSAGGTALLAGG